MNQQPPFSHSSNVVPIPSAPELRRASDAPATIDINALIAAFRRRLDLFFLGVFAVGVVGAAMVLQMTPRYSATASVLIDQQQMNVTGFESILSGLPADSAAIDTEARIIRSRALAQKVSEEMKLAEDPEFNFMLREPSRLSVWEKSLKDGIKGVLRAAGVMSSSEPEPAPAGSVDSSGENVRVENLLMSRLRATRIGLTHLIEISYETETPWKAAAVANAYADAYVERQLEAKFEATRKANEWLSERLAALRAEVEQAERDVEAYRAEEGLLSAEGAPIIESQIAEINAQLFGARAELGGDEARLRAARAWIRRGGGAESIPEALDSAVIGELRSQQALVARRRGELESELGPRHPEMVRVNREFSDLQRQIDQELQRIVSSLESRAAVSQARLASLEADLAIAQDRLVESNRSQVRLRELERSAEANRALYESFLNRFKQTSEQQGVEEADAQIVSRAALPENPSFPNRRVLGLLIIIAAGGFGVALVVLAEFLDSGYRNPEELEASTGAPVLGTIPLLTKREAKVDGETQDLIDYVVSRPFSVFAEAFRNLKASLVTAGPDQPGQLIVFTSGMPGEGKTTSTISFARTLALAGTKVIALDGDLRRRMLSRAFDFEVKSGLIEVVGQEATLDSAIKEDPSGAHFLPLSPIRYTAQDVFATEAFDRVLAELRGRYEVILVDSAPILAVADTLSLVKKADTVTVMVRWARTSRHIVKVVVDELRKLQVQRFAFALTYVNRRASLKYGYYSTKYARYYVN